MTVNVRLMEQADEKKWDDYVSKSNDATPFHLIGWKKTVEETYRHKAYYLLAEDSGDNVVGILPSFLIGNMRFQKSLVSQPFAPYGGICCDDEAAKQKLVAEMLGMGKRLKAGKIEFRQLRGADSYEHFQSMNYYHTFVLDLSSGLETIWKTMDKKVRNMVRKGEKSQLTFRVHSGAEALPTFYDVYSRSMSRLGTPVHHRDFFTNLQRNVGGVNIAVAEHEGKAVGALYLLAYKDTIISVWGASLSEYLHMSPNNHLYWKSIEFAADRKMGRFDFGRSLIDTGNYKFKQGWGSEDIPLHYHYHPSNGQIKPIQQEYGKLARVWKAIPAPVTLMLGPALRRRIP